MTGSTKEIYYSLQIALSTAFKSIVVRMPDILNNRMYAKVVDKSLFHHFMITLKFEKYHVKVYG